MIVKCLQIAEIHNVAKRWLICWFFDDCSQHDIVSSKGECIRISSVFVVIELLVVLQNLFEQHCARICGLNDEQE